jgi:hypothetical protein
VLLGFAARSVSQHKAYILQNELDTKTKQLKAIADEAKQKAIETEAKVKPRRLSEAQKQIIMHNLKEFKGAKIVVREFLSDKDTVDYGQDFVSSLKAAGWDVREGPILVFGNSPVGIELIINDQNNPPPGAYALLGLLKQNAY